MNAHNEQQPAAAQEAVGEMVRRASGITVPQMYGSQLPAGTKLYAAPAAQADARSLALAVEQALGWRDGERDAELDSLLETAMSILDRTPAAPGIDILHRALVNIAKGCCHAQKVADDALAEFRIDASPKGDVPALPDDFSESKDWRAGSYAERVEWLMDTVRSQREHIDDLLDSSKGSATEYCIDRAVEAFDDVFDGVSNNKREAIAAALAAGTKDSPKGAVNEQFGSAEELGSPKGGSEARDSVLAALVEAATAVERADADGELTDDLVDRLRAARDAAQAGDAEVQP